MIDNPTHKNTNTNTNTILFTLLVKCPFQSHRFSHASLAQKQIMIFEEKNSRANFEKIKVLHTIIGFLTCTECSISLMSPAARFISTSFLSPVLFRNRIKLWVDVSSLPFYIWYILSHWWDCKTFYLYFCVILLLLGWQSFAERSQ